MKQRTLSDQIEINRKKIDHIDRELSALLRQRILVAQKIIAAKKMMNKKQVDPDREEHILKKYQKKLKSVSTPKRLKALVIAILRSNQKYKS
ncbi:MAG: hypothetical protein A2622_01550 [Bdellovibrionales bacterium RIFCSPHIGHO2_01_FULL_40_29]|nr:MAG: hypothetical protein A2622_01550 [Bdellovibrionales bacterium RIFCSPHIGHO2_01_FULL_40_29]OFZ33781.1 MAG: hypothetical protein A3D17_01970 [Bdellovibrionales bacterium RIFCSPHIGHO2_02_FULL_40_15]